MMYHISICYRRPADPDSFDAYYRDVHAPLAAQIPGLASFTTEKCRSLMPGQSAIYYMVARLGFATAADMKAALKSSEMAAANEDVARFASGGITVFSGEGIDRM